MRACCKNRFIIEIYGYVMLVYIRVFYCFSVINQCLCVFLLYSPCVLTKNDVWSQMQTAGIYNINFYTAAADNVWKSKDFILIINGHNIKKEKIIYYLLFSFTRSSQQLYRCIAFMTFLSTKKQFLLIQ